MRLFNNEKKVVVLNKKKIVLILVFILTVVFCLIFQNAMGVYREELRAMLKIKSNNAFTEVINDAVLEVNNENNFKFIDITYNEGKVAALNYNTADINTFKAKVISNALENINNKKCNFRIYLSDIFKNPFLLNKGTSFNVECYPVAGIKAECYSKFEDAGVNQTKNSIYFEFTTDIYTGSAVFNTVNSFKYTVAVCETVIVGDVSESYTNVSEDSNTKDTVLNLQ